MFSTVKRMFLMSTAVSVAWPAAANAQQAAVELPTVVVKTPLDGVVTTTSKAAPRNAPRLAAPAVTPAAEAAALVTVPDGVSLAAPTAIDALSGSSAVDRSQIDTQFQADQISQVLRTIPGVTTQETARDTATAINIRGLQDFGRVNVLVEGARQNFQRSGHSANGAFYLDPEMIKRVDVTRGPTATVYGSGAIGGVAAFELLDADDILKPGEYMAGRTRTRYSSNGDGKLASWTGAVRAGNFDIVAQMNGRWSHNYEDGSGTEVSGSNDKTKSNLLKTRWRPALGHQISLSYLNFTSKFEDQVQTGGSLRDTTVDNNQLTIGYTYARPDTPLLGLSVKVYKNRTDMEQSRKADVTVPKFSATAVPGVCAPGSFFIGSLTCMGFVTFPAGAERFFNVDTEGFDVFNTSRFVLSPSAKLALTYGGDAFRDKVDTFDPTEGGDELTPNGQRSVYGAFVQANFKLAPRRFKWVA